MTPHPRPFLTIDARHPGHVRFRCGDGQRTGSLRMLLGQRLGEYSLWLARTAGRDVLDQFELQCIREGLIEGVRLRDEDGGTVHATAELLALERTDDGLYLRWASKVECHRCKGEGYLEGCDLEDHEEEGTCDECGGEGHVLGAEVVTDYDGRMLPETAGAFMAEQEFTRFMARD
jgi:hypothetical protein